MTIDKDGNIKIEVDSIKKAAMRMLHMIARIRTAGGLPLVGYDFVHTPTTEFTLLENTVIQTAKILAIDLGVENPGDLDVRKYG